MAEYIGVAKEGKIFHGRIERLGEAELLAKKHKAQVIRYEIIDFDEE